VAENRYAKTATFFGKSVKLMRSIQVNEGL